MEVRVSPMGREHYGAWREGTHDDLVFAVALSCWGAAKEYPRSEEWWTSAGCIKIPTREGIIRFIIENIDLGNQA